MGVQQSIARGMTMLAQLEQTSQAAAAPISLADAQGAAVAAMAGGLSGLDDGLAGLYFATSGRAGTMAAYLDQSMSLGLAAAALSSDGRYVTVDVSVKAGGDAAALLTQLQGAGLVNGSTYAGVVSGDLPVAVLGQISSLSMLGQAHATMMVLDVGSVESQGVKAERADLAQTAHPTITGAGVRLGILSTSFDTDASAVTHMAGDIASGDLPTDTVVVADSSAGTPTDEGRAMAQLAHDVAPGASIDFATASGGQAAFANNIVALAEQHGDKVIVDDVRYMQELSYQNGPIAQAIEKVVQTDGVTYFSSDTNDSNHGWEGAWAGGSTFTQNGMSYTSLAFAPGQDYLPVTLTNAGETGTFSLQWDEPGASAGGPGATSDLDVFVYSDAAMTKQVGSMTANQIGADPVALFALTSTTAGQTFYIRVAYNSTRGGGAPPEVRLVSVSDGAPMTVGTTTSNINAGAVLGHKVGGDAIGVGEDTYAHTPAYNAAYPNGQLDAQSGVGFDKVTFSDAGTRLATPVISTPQIVGVDGVSTTFFPSADNPGPYVFNGTSAAAPDVAAVAVLMLQANGALTRDDVLALIQDSALDMDNPYTPGFDAGFDTATGAGLVQADLAVNFALGGVISNPSQTTLHGTHLNDQIVGSAANDTISGGGGNDVIDGGAGVDTVVFSGAAAQYAIRYNADGSVTVTDQRAGSPDGADTLRNVEQLAFSDTTVSVGVSPTPSLPTPPPPSSPSSSFAIQADNLIRAAATDPALSDPTSPVYAQAQAAAALGAQSASGQLNPLDAQAALYRLVDGTTSVAEIAYAFFTGRTPTAAGLDYLVHSGANPTDLEDAYYARFSTENRYINFSANLATGAGAGAAAFQANYGSLSLSDATAKAYAAVFGFAPAAGKIDAILNAPVSNGLGGTETRAQYFSDITGGSPAAQKAAAIGFLLADSVKEGFGTYQQADLHFLADLAHGTAVFNVDLLAAYTQAPALVGQPVVDPTLGS